MWLPFFGVPLKALPPGKTGKNHGSPTSTDLNLNDFFTIFLLSFFFLDRFLHQSRDKFLH